MRAVLCVGGGGSLSLRFYCGSSGSFYAAPKKNKTLLECTAGYKQISMYMKIATSILLQQFSRDLELEALCGLSRPLVVLLVLVCAVSLGLFRLFLGKIGIDLDRDLQSI